MLKNKGNVLTPLLIAVAVVAIVAAGFFFYQNQQLQKRTSSQEQEVSKANPTPTLSNKTTSWRTYENKKYGFAFKYPTALTFEELEMKGESGFEFCLIFKKETGLLPMIVKPVQAALAWCSVDNFGVGGSSINFSAGRSGGFLDGQGYTKKSGLINFNFPNNKEYQIPQELIKVIRKNQFGVEMIIVQGKSEKDSSFEVPGTPGEGFTGAIINLKSSELTGLQFKLADNSNFISPKEFDQILSTFKFLGTNSEETNILKTETLKYVPQTSWQTYTDEIGKFSIQYGPNNKISETIPGELVNFLGCYNYQGQEFCPDAFRIKIYQDYDGGSRRLWLTKKFTGLTRPYYQDLIVSGSTALVAMDGNTGGSTGSWVLIPRGSKIYSFFSPTGWNPDTKDTSALEGMKKILSTFRFL